MTSAPGVAIQQLRPVPRRGSWEGGLTQRIEERRPDHHPAGGGCSGGRCQFQSHGRHLAGSAQAAASGVVGTSPGASGAATGGAGWGEAARYRPPVSGGTGAGPISNPRTASAIKRHYRAKLTDEEIIAALRDPERVPRRPDGRVSIKAAVEALGIGPDRARRLLDEVGLRATTPQQVNGATGEHPHRRSLMRS